MAIAFDTSIDGTFGATPFSWNHTCTGSNRFLCVCVATASTGDVVTGVTYNGVAMTQVGKALGGGATEVYLYVLANPASGSNAIVVTASSGTLLGCSTSYTGAQASSTADSSNTGTTAGGAASLTLSTTVVAANCWLVGVWHASGGALSAGTGTTLRQNPATQIAIGDSNGPVSTGSQSLQATQASSQFAGVIASFTEGSGVGLLLTELESGPTRGVVRGMPGHIH